jgi:hypothetical protein
MRISSVDIDVEKLVSKDTLLEELRSGESCDRDLADIRSRYYSTFGNELIWRYPISDGYHAGVTIVTVKEGFLSLPYHEMTETDYEIFELDKAAMFDEDALMCFIDDWKSFSDDLLGALGDMLKIVCGQ